MMSGNKVLSDTNAIILATAKNLGAQLLSEDWDDFLGIDDKVIVRDLSSIKR